jgi:hypothetical protein
MDGKFSEFSLDDLLALTYKQPEKLSESIKHITQQLNTKVQALEAWAHQHQGDKVHATELLIESMTLLTHLAYEINGWALGHFIDHLADYLAFKHPERYLQAVNLRAHQN